MDLADFTSTLNFIGNTPGYNIQGLNDLSRNMFLNYSPMNPTTLNMSDLQPPVEQLPVQSIAGNGYSDSFNSSYDFTAKWEGGYSNHKNDRGGATNYGISSSLLRSLHPNESEEQIRNRINNMSREDAKRIMYNEFWKKNKGDSIQDRDVAKFMFDTSVNHGQVGGAKMLQRAINNVTGAGLKVDGKIGNKTLRVLNNSNSRAILQEYIRLRGNNYNDIIKRRPSQKVFRKGWFNRLNALADEVNLSRYS